MEVSANKFNPQITPHTPSPASSEYCWIKDKRVKINDLHQNLKAFYYDMNQKFPGLCITSGDDGKHSHGSRHYCNCAIDIG